MTLFIIEITALIGIFKIPANALKIPEKILTIPFHMSVQFAVKMPRKNVITPFRPSSKPAITGFSAAKAAPNTPDNMFAREETIGITYS